MRKFITSALLAAALAQSAAAESVGAPPPAILPLRERAAVIDAALRERLDTIVPRLMREQGIDMWVLVARENLEDPVVATMLDARSLRARRRTVLVFFDPGAGRPVERLTVSRYGLAGVFKADWEPEKEPDQWKRLAQIIAERNPKKIALNISSLTAFGDGLTKSQHDDMVAAWPAAMRSRIVSGEPLAVGWLETRSPLEMQRYPGIMAIAHTIIAEAFSSKFITPGVTTAEEVQWWLRERIAEQKLDTWFHPSVNIARQGSPQLLDGPAVIQPGDLLWTDFGIAYLRLNTDSQQLAYVLKPGETDAPAGLKAGLAAANRVQDILIAEFRTGATGNEMLLAARAKAAAAGLQTVIYSHPLGFHGHAAGSAIGFWDDQKPTDRGEHPLVPNTVWSIELVAGAPVPEWGGQVVPFRQEVDGVFDGTRFRWLDGRQTRLHLIGGRASPQGQVSNPRSP